MNNTLPNKLTILGNISVCAADESSVYFRYYYIGLATKSFRIFFMIFKASLLIQITNINQLYIDHFVR